MDNRSGRQQPDNRPGTGATRQNAGTSGSSGTPGSPGAASTSTPNTGGSTIGSAHSGSASAGSANTGNIRPTTPPQRSQPGSSMTDSDDASMGEKARRLAQEARSKATDATHSQLTTQKGRVAESLGIVAESLRSSGDRLKERHEVGAGKFFGQAADQVERFAGAMERRDVNEMMNEVEHFARRQPAVFLGGAFALGLVAARFFKASSHEHDSQRDSMSRSSYGRGTMESRDRDYMPDREVPTSPVRDTHPADASTRSTTVGNTPEIGR